MSGARPKASARTVTFDTLRAVADSDAYANLLLPHAIARAGLSPGDARLATELTYGTLRRQGTYDAIIQIAARREVGTIDAPVLDALRLGAHQLLATRIPPHAAVNESVGLVRAYVGARATGFANAVLRTIGARTRDEWLDELTAAAPSIDARLAVVHSHPIWVIRALRRALAAEGAEDEVEELLEADNRSPQVTFAALPGLAHVPDDARATPYSPLGFRHDSGDPAQAIADAHGRVRVQDEGSQLVALALSRCAPVRPGERWLDLCAAPGGKTAVLAAEAYAHGAHLDANEIAPARAELVRGSLQAIPMEVPVTVADGREVASEHASRYDRILVDAPCSGLGALRRRPEARWRKKPADLPALMTMQRELLDAAIDALAPGGVVAYVTCSPHRAETAGIVAEVMRERGDEVSEISATTAITQVALSDPGIRAQRDGTSRAQLWPHRQGTDAMSMTLLRRRPLR